MCSELSHTSWPACAQACGRRGGPLLSILIRRSSGTIRGGTHQVPCHPVRRPSLRIGSLFGVRPLSRFGVRGSPVTGTAPSSLSVASGTPTRPSAVALITFRTALCGYCGYCDRRAYLALFCEEGGGGAHPSHRTVPEDAGTAHHTRLVRYVFVTTPRKLRVLRSDRPGRMWHPSRSLYDPEQNGPRVYVRPRNRRALDGRPPTIAGRPLETGS